MKIEFFKYQGTGNDFIMIDGESHSVIFSEDQIKNLCDRRFGIGADGLIVLRKHPIVDFDMDYYNADGSKSFCGNGSRCAQAFAHDLGWISKESSFMAIDGKHHGKSIEGNYATLMMNVNEIQNIDSDYFIDTGSPHYIKYVDSTDDLDVVNEGRKIRNSSNYKKEGVNVNFVEETEGLLKMRTYERGVEDETFSCGTGATAVAISYLLRKSVSLEEVEIKTKGGNLKIALKQKEKSKFEEIWLIGPAEKIFEGSIDLELLSY